MVHQNVFHHVVVHPFVHQQDFIILCFISRFMMLLFSSKYCSSSFFSIQIFGMVLFIIVLFIITLVLQQLLFTFVHHFVLHPHVVDHGFSTVPLTVAPCQCTSMTHCTKPEHCKIKCVCTIITKCNCGVVDVHVSEFLKLERGTFRFPCCQFQK